MKDNLLGIGKEVKPSDIERIAKSLPNLPELGGAIIAIRCAFYGPQEIHMQSDDFLRLYGAKNRRKFDDKYDVVDNNIEGVRVHALIESWKF